METCDGLTSSRAPGRTVQPAPDLAYSSWVEACVTGGWKPQPGADQVAVAGALGRVTAAPIRARRPAPRFSCAAMDGIAVKASAVAARPAGNESAGRQYLGPALFVQVDTGEPMPPGTDTVVERERVQHESGGGAWIAGKIEPRRHVRAQGEDFRAGELLIPSGRRLRPVDLAAAASGGHEVLPVVRPPVVTIIPTGNEIRPVGSPLGPGQVADTNSIMLAAQVMQAGGRPALRDVQPDDSRAIAAGICRATPTSDFILIIAGSSRGRRDHTADVLAQVGCLAVSGVAVRPGHPALLGYVPRARAASAGSGGAVPVIGVPGYPLAAAVVFELFAIPLLAALQGMPKPVRGRLRAQLGCGWTSPPDVEDWVPVSLSGGAGEHGARLLATPSGRGAGSISRLVRANAWWQIPVGLTTFASGDYIDVQPMTADLAIVAAPGCQSSRR